MAVEEVTFGFGTEAFEAGIDKIVQKLDVMEKSFSNKAKKMTKGFSAITGTFSKVGSIFKKTIGFIITPIKALFTTVFSVFKGIGGFIADVTKQVLALSGAFLLVKAGIGLVRAVLDKIPEIKTTFGIVKDIFFRNLLFPLRQHLLPLLQKVLDWARNNRALFVKWGGVLVQVFKVVSEGVRVAVKLLSAFFTGFSNTLKRIFGLTAKSVSDIANIVIFKLVATILFLEVLLAPIFKKAGEKFAELASKAGEFFKEIAAGFKSVEGFGDTFEEIKKVFLSIFDIKGSDNKGIGFIIGKVVKKGLIFLADMVLFILKVVRAIADVDFKKLIKVLKSGAIGFAIGAAVGLPFGPGVSLATGLAGAAISQVIPEKLPGLPTVRTMGVGETFEDFKKKAKSLFGIGKGGDTSLSPSANQTTNNKKIENKINIENKVIIEKVTEGDATETGKRVTSGMLTTELNLILKNDDMRGR